jgi:membrane protease YdiL (CAAX protease family)
MQASRQWGSSRRLLDNGRPDMTSTAAARSRRVDLWGFLAFSHGWTWLFWTVASLWGTSIWHLPAVSFFVIGGAGVFLGGMVMTLVVHGVVGLRDLGRRIVDPTRIAGRWWAVILLFFPTVTLLAAALARGLGTTEQPFDLSGVGERVTHPAGLASMMAFTLIIGPLPEEIGWRGYLLDHVQARWNALSASLIVGLLMWIWHLPLFRLPGYSDAFAAIPPTPLRLLFVILPAAVLYTWVYNNTGRSVLAVILFHFTGNFSGEFFGISDEAQTYRLVLTAMAVALILWRWGPDTLRGDRESAMERGQP